MRRYEQISVQNRRIRFNGGSLTQKFHVEAVASTNHSSSQKTKLNVLSQGIKIWRDFSPFCHNVRVCQTDGRTDKRTDGRTYGHSHR